MKDLFLKMLGRGTMRSQGLFRRLYHHAIYGMNYASPNHFENGELVALRYVAGRLRESPAGPPTVFDVGANVGEYALEMRRAFGPAAAIYCFEPSLGCQAALAEKAAADPGLTVLPFGLGEAEGSLSLHYAEPTSTIASVYAMRPDHPWKTDNTQTVAIRTADQFCRERGIDTVDFLKIDVEGHELPVLIGARGLIERGAVRFIQFEFGFRQIDSRCYFRDFFQLLAPRYRVGRIVRDGVVPIDGYDESLEVFVGVSNYLAELRPTGGGG